MTPWTVACQTPLCNSLGKNTGVGSHFLLQMIFLTWGLNPGLAHCRQILYHLNQGSPVGEEPLQERSMYVGERIYHYSNQDTFESERSYDGEQEMAFKQEL